jgi:hypothetical protein
MTACLFSYSLSFCTNKIAILNRSFFLYIYSIYINIYKDKIVKVVQHTILKVHTIVKYKGFYNYYIVEINVCITKSFYVILKLCTLQYLYLLLL